jgi:hypothetical protein
MFILELTRRIPYIYRKQSTIHPISAGSRLHTKMLSDFFWNALGETNDTRTTGPNGLSNTMAIEEKTSSCFANRIDVDLSNLKRNIQGKNTEPKFANTSFGYLPPETQRNGFRRSNQRCDEKRTKPTIQSSLKTTVLRDPIPKKKEC